MSINRFLIENSFVYSNTWKGLSVVVRAFEDLQLTSLQRIHHGFIVQYPGKLDSGLGKKQEETFAYVTVIVFQSNERVSTPGWGRRQSGSTPTANQNMCNVGFSEKICLRTKFNMIESKQDEHYCDSSYLINKMDII